MGRTKRAFTPISLCGTFSISLAATYFFYISHNSILSCWLDLTKGCLDDESIMFNILRKPCNSYIAPEDFLLVLEGIFVYL
jgi:hypothetical protein